jgi:carbamoyltransferase
MNNSYLGPEFSDSRIEADLKKVNLSYRKLEREPLLEAVAEQVAAGNVVGWFQGRMEWGPRALGNRSIVAHPGRPDMKDVLNARIKHREWFRPFAPSILVERQNEYFEYDHPSPFMLHVYKIRPEKREQLCAVNHVDNTGRLQTVSHEEDPLYYDLIRAFERKTGIPVILNTSFNENEPIVCAPEEAIDCFKRTRMACSPSANAATRADTPMRRRKHRSDTVSRRTEGCSSNQLACPPESGRNPHD